MACKIPILGGFLARNRLESLLMVPLLVPAVQARPEIGACDSKRMAGLRGE
jgi:hypothetical protein